MRGAGSSAAFPDMREKEVRGADSRMDLVFLPCLEWPQGKSFTHPGRTKSIRSRKRSRGELSRLNPRTLRLKTHPNGSLSLLPVGGFLQRGRKTGRAGRQIWKIGVAWGRDLANLVQLFYHKSQTQILIH